jgi:hypothetical protein
MLVVTVRVNMYAIQVRTGLLPFAGVRVPVRAILGATVSTMPAQPWRSWGWWWRNSRQRTIAIRSGPCLHLDVGFGRSLVVSLNHAEGAVAALSRAGVTVRWPKRGASG